MDKRPDPAPQHYGLFVTGADAKRIETKIDLLQHGIDALHVLMGISLQGDALRLKQELRMSKELDDLTAEVSQDTQVVSSAITLIAGLEQQIKDAGTDPAKLQALTTNLAQSRSDLATAIAANTPAAPNPTT